MKCQVIGNGMNHGFAGSYSRQPDMVIDTHPLGGSGAVLFGTPLVYGTDGAVIAFGPANTAADFVGIASRQIKSATNYLNQNEGAYQPLDAASVFKHGCINVLCNVGTPLLGRKAYIRTAENAAIPTGKIGGFEAAADGTNTVELTNCEWRGGKDVNGVAELRIKTINRA